MRHLNVELEKLEKRIAPKVEKLEKRIAPSTLSLSLGGSIGANLGLGGTSGSGTHGTGSHSG